MIVGMDKTGKLFDKALQPMVLELAQGDVILFYTDGADECRGVQKDSFGKERIFQAMRDRAGQSAQEIVEGIEADLLEHCKKTNLEDDVTLVALSVD